MKTYFTDFLQVIVVAIIGSFLMSTYVHAVDKASQASAHNGITGSSAVADVSSGNCAEVTDNGQLQITNYTDKFILATADEAIISVPCRVKSVTMNGTSGDVFLLYSGSDTSTGTVAYEAVIGSAGTTQLNLDGKYFNDVYVDLTGGSIQFLYDEV